VLFEASTTSGSNVPEGNERVVCSGLFKICFGREKIVFYQQTKFLVFCFGYFSKSVYVFFSVFFFFSNEIHVSKQSKTLRKCNCKGVKQKANLPL
jgi:hypothetical protein